MLPLVIFVLLCLAVGWVGRDRQLGFLGTFLLSVLLSPLIGLLALLAGRPAAPRTDTPAR